MSITCILQSKDLEFNNNKNKNKNLFDASVCENMEEPEFKYNEFINIIYIELTENWLCLGTAAHHLNAASGFVGVVNGVDIIGANVTENNHIIVVGLDKSN
jgi:hypothetical protein